MGNPSCWEHHAHEHNPWGFTLLTMDKSSKPMPRLNCDEVIPDFWEKVNELSTHYTSRAVVIATLLTLHVRTGSLKPVLTLYF